MKKKKKLNALKCLVRRDNVAGYLILEYFNKIFFGNSSIKTSIMSPVCYFFLFLFCSQDVKLLE